MRRDAMIQFDGWLKKQGISYKGHAEAMATLADIDKMEFKTLYNWDLPIEDLIACEKRSLEWVTSIGAAESIERIQNKINYLASKKLEQLTLGGVA